MADGAEADSRLTLTTLFTSFRVICADLERLGSACASAGLRAEVRGGGPARSRPRLLLMVVCADCDCAVYRVFAACHRRLLFSVAV